MGKFEVSLNLENIGPHSGKNVINFSNEVSSNKVVIYAPNGAGKTFISRAFRLASQERMISDADYVLSLGQDRGNISFLMDKDKSLKVDLVRGQKPNIQNNTGLIFCVFNSDYVKENISPSNYNPDGKVSGYILGKEQIDLSKNYKRKAEVEKTIAKINDHIERRVFEKKEETRKLGVHNNTKEMENFTVNNVRSMKSVECQSSSSEIMQHLNVLKDVPEDIPDIKIPRIDINLETYEQAKKILNESYPNTDWDKDFVEYYQKHMSFITEGLENIQDNQCPFCHQKLSEDALRVICKYREYSEKRELNVVKEIQTLITKIKNDIFSITNFFQGICKARCDLDEVKKFFPSIKKIEFEGLVINDSTLAPLNKIIKALEKKTHTLSDKTSLSEEDVNEYSKLFDEIDRIQKVNNDNIIKVNDAKNDSKGERLKLRKDLCLANFLEIQNELSPKFEELEKEEENLKKIRGEIKEKQSKIGKRDRVVDTLSSLLSKFFFDKYTVNKETFCLELNGDSIENHAADILSDGEKSIVAFCLFLANVHRYIEREEDYEKLFFVIDDPISSMDFHYVYVLAQILREIETLFKICGHKRMWIFTHNIEFASIIIRNHVIPDGCSFEMRPGEIVPLNYTLLMPYENHLRDIVKIAKGKQDPDHTTANSIRHVLETICKFEYPNKNLKKYINEHRTLSSSVPIYSLCQDMSHGHTRMEPACTNEILREACKALYDFMNEKYSGQIEAIK